MKRILLATLSALCFVFNINAQNDTNNKDSIINIKEKLIENNDTSDLNIKNTIEFNDIRYQNNSGENY